MIAGLDGLSLGLTIVLGSLGLIAVLAVAWVYGVSQLRQSTAALQEQANAAQEQIIESMKAKQDEMAGQITDLQTKNESQGREILSLREQVTHAANVDALTQAVKDHADKVDGHFVSIDTRLSELVAATKETT